MSSKNFLFLKIRSELCQNLIGTIIRVLVRNLKAHSEIINQEGDQRLSVQSEPSVPPTPINGNKSFLYKISKFDITKKYRTEKYPHPWFFAHFPSKLDLIIVSSIHIQNRLSSEKSTIFLWELEKKWLKLKNEESL